MRLRIPIGLFFFGLVLTGVSRSLLPNSSGMFGVILQSVGVAFLASSVTAFLYELRSAENLKKFIATVAAVEGKQAIEQVANGTFDAVVTRFEEIYRDYVPSRVFENSSATKQFNGFFNRWLIESDAYRYRGDIAQTTTYQLHQVWASHTGFTDKNRTYYFLLMDPRSEEAFIQRAHMKLEAMASSEGEAISPAGAFGDEKEIERRKEWARNQIQGAFVSLYSLWRTAQRHRVSIKVGFYSEVPFYRCELLHDGMFINYYIRGAFAGTFFYRRGSLLYHAFSEAFDLAFEHSRKVPDLLTIADEAFVEFLRKELSYPNGSQSNKEILESLHRQREKRFEDLQKLKDVFQTVLPAAK